ncbi:hypothetical protein ACJRO7_033776 [Eucalyptus globulus]|uniref:beta-galactosidase n=1 Tax=Eucalyptus globulus TaxID=34317 RepID=A0ABD3J957_EUCGL
MKLSLETATTIVALILFSFLTSCFAANVTYERRSLIIDGQRKLFISASIHYPRSVPGAKEGGANTIESYVFRNGHEPSQGNYYFEDRCDLVKLVKIVQNAGTYMILRIGPFITAEWNFGGLPIWLHFVPGTVFRTNNVTFKALSHEEIRVFIVKLMKKEKLYALQGGPIILAQAKPHVMWAARMAVSQNTVVPWVMCQQPNAPEYIIDTCNAFYCDQYTPNSPKKRKPPPLPSAFAARPSPPLAFAVARRHTPLPSPLVRYHGGTNFGHTNGGPFITTSYDYEVPIDEYGLPRFPKWGHLKELHISLMLCEHVLLNGEPTTANVYTSSGFCVAFLANIDDEEDKTILFRNMSYHLPACLNGFVDHLNTTKYRTDHLWYKTRFLSIGNFFYLSFNSSPSILLSIMPPFHLCVYHALCGSGYGNGLNVPFNFSASISLKAGKNDIAILSLTVGTQNQPLKPIVDPPTGNEPVGLDMIHMGLAWLNGQQIGIYWPRLVSFANPCVRECNYRGYFKPNKCLTGCGEPSQGWYHVPRSWFKPSGNVLVILEEVGGDPTKVTFSKRKISTVWSYPDIDDDSSQYKAPRAHLKCPDSTQISAVNFASFGNQVGSCGSYSLGDCHDPSFKSVVEKACLNKNEFTVELTEGNFSKNLCPGLKRKLAVEAVCG